MCLEIIATVGYVLGVVGQVTGGLFNVYSQIQQGKAQQAQLNYQAQIEKQNAKIAQANAMQERQQGIEEARLQRLKASSAIGSQQAAMAANGVDITQGTPLDIISDTAAMGELDALQTQTNYESRALAYEAQAGNFNNQANLDIIAGKNAYNAGIYKGLASGVEGIGKLGDVATKWYSFGSSSGGTEKVNYTNTLRNNKKLFSGGFDKGQILST